MFYLMLLIIIIPLTFKNLLIQDVVELGLYHMDCNKFMQKLLLQQLRMTHISAIAFFVIYGFVIFVMTNKVESINGFGLMSHSNMLFSILFFVLTIIMSSLFIGKYWINYRIKNKGFYQIDATEYPLVALIDTSKKDSDFQAIKLRVYSLEYYKNLLFVATGLIVGFVCGFICLT